MRTNPNIFTSNTFSYPLMSGWPSFTSAMPNPWHERTVSNSTFPRVDIIENDSSIMYFFEIPGADAQRINLEVSATEIYLTAPLANNKHYENARFIYRERPGSDYSRVLSIPRSVVIDDIKADYRNGVLEVTLPKQKNKQ